ncbi:hypothetical protein PCK1_001518 [Pneumocystis canis]|nr:hypothetical protein PCK1_001518 [Pneumocystis canis]
MTDPLSKNRVQSGHNSALTSATDIPTFSNTGWNGNILLFFVALGFGILFCNLWVIIGIKYCYRYSAANRPETIEIEGITPQGQTCQKKLMTRGEADQQFPSILYKVWKSQHKREKQSSHKAISINEQNKQSLADTISVCNSTNILDSPNGQEKSLDSNASYHKSLVEKDTNNHFSDSCTNFSSDIPKTSCYDPSFVENNDINIYISDEKQSKHEEEYVNESKHRKVSSADSVNDLFHDDSCAICLDTFEGEDEVRVLTCGHIYHSSCIVPWFTTRRAMCPLCKYDFYIPKTLANTNIENTSRNIDLFPEAQVYDHHRRRLTMTYFSAFEPQHFEQYRKQAQGIHYLEGSQESHYLGEIILLSN